MVQPETEYGRKRFQIAEKREQGEETEGKNGDLSSEQLVQTQWVNMCED